MARGRRILDRFPEDGLEAVWRVPIRGGYSGPVVADGRVFVTDWQRIEGTRAITGKERILALDEETGEELWSHEWDVNYSALQQSYAIGPRSTPTIDGDTLYVMGAVGHLIALEAETGEVIWSYDSVEQGNASITIWGFTSSPLVYGDLLIQVVGAEPDGKVIAFDKHTGEEVWRSLSSDWENGLRPADDLRARRRRRTAHRLGAEGGQLAQPGERRGLLERAPGEVASGMTVTTPVVDGDRLLFSQFYRGSLLLEFDSEKPEVRELWRGQSRSEMPEETDGLHSLITTPILEGDTIYGVCSYGQLRGLNAADGSRLWESDEMTRQGRWGAAFMVRHGDRWFVNNDLGDLIIARFSRDGYEEIDRARLIEPTTQSRLRSAAALRRNGELDAPGLCQPPHRREERRGDHPCLPGRRIALVAVEPIRLAVVLASTAILAAAPAAAQAGSDAQGPVGELIFPLEHWHNHGSSVVELPNGDLLVAWFHGSGERRSDDVRIMGARLRAGGTVWSAPFLLADTPGFPDTNCTLLLEPVAAGGHRLWLFWPTIQANLWESALMKFKVSTDFEGPGPPVWQWQGRASHEARRRLPRPGGGEDGRVLPEPRLRRRQGILPHRSLPGSGRPAIWSRRPTS